MKITYEQLGDMFLEMVKKTDEELKDMVLDMQKRVVVTGHYVHNKTGGRYIVKGVALEPGDEIKQKVIYTSTSVNTIPRPTWSRDLEDFLAKFSVVKEYWQEPTNICFGDGVDVETKVYKVAVDNGPKLEVTVEERKKND